jgi:hypothetical protein
MAELPMDELVASWTGFPGAPGYSVFHSSHTSSGVHDALVSLFTSFKNLIPASVKISFPGSGRVLDAVTGNQIDVWGGETTDVVQGSEGGKYSAPTGMAINWQTSTIHRNKIVRGRTFVVPMAGVLYDTDGSLAATYVTDFNASVAAFVSGLAGAFVVWSRPLTSSSADGLSCPVVSGRIPDKAAILTSRRP